MAPSSMFTVQASPEEPYQRAPACWASPAQVATSSPAKSRMRALPLEAVFTFFAAASNSSQVLGTSTPYSANRSLR